MNDLFHLCKSQCGKIVSSIEKTEENLKTGEKTVFDSSKSMETTNESKNCEQNWKI